jgi:hypothetical protein
MVTNRKIYKREIILEIMNRARLHEYTEREFKKARESYSCLRRETGRLYKEAATFCILAAVFTGGVVGKISSDYRKRQEKIEIQRVEEGEETERENYLRDLRERLREENIKKPHCISEGNFCV